jgi:hypothetical protein
MIGVPDQLVFGGLAVALAILGLALHQSLANFAAWWAALDSNQ